MTHSAFAGAFALTTFDVARPDTTPVTCVSYAENEDVSHSPFMDCKESMLVS